MNGPELVASQLAIGQEMLLRAVDGIPDEHFHTQLPPTRETPNWIFGHLAYNESFFQNALVGEPQVLADWRERYFLDSSQPAPGRFDGYPSRQDVIDAFVAQRKRSLEILATLDGHDWSGAPPPSFPALFDSRGAVWGVLATHQHWHFGQLVTIRGLLGLPYFSP